MAFDYKKEYREFYLPPKKPTLVTIPPMNFAAVQGYAINFGTRRHHEIYLDDPRKTAPDKCKTVLRHPVVKK